MWRMMIYKDHKAIYVLQHDHVSDLTLLREKLEKDNFPYRIFTYNHIEQTWVPIAGRGAGILNNMILTKAKLILCTFEQFNLRYEWRNLEPEVTLD